MKKIIFAVTILFFAVPLFSQANPIPDFVVLSDLHIGKNNGTFELDSLNGIVNQLIVKYRNSEKPLIILCGDNIDHCTPVASIISKAQQAGLLPSSGTDILTDPFSTWYYELHLAIKPLLGNGFKIISTLGNHDVSPLERYDQIGTVTNIEGPFSSVISNEEGQKDFNRGISAYAQSQGYAVDKLTGSSLANWAIRMYESWIKREHNLNPNFISEPYYFCPTVYSINPDKVRELIIYLKSNPADNIPNDLVDNLFVFQRGYDVLSVSSIDNTATQFGNQRLYLSNGSYTLQLALPSRFLMHDCRIRASAGYVDSSQIGLIKQFNKIHTERHRLALNSLRDLVFTQFQEQGLPSRIYEQVWRQLPRLPEPAKIVFTHHNIDYHVLRYGLNTPQHLADMINYEFKRWTGGSYQNSTFNLSMLEIAARLKIIPWSDWLLFTDRFHFEQDGLGKMFMLQSVYGQYISNLKYGLPVYVPTDHYSYSGNEIIATTDHYSYSSMVTSTPFSTSGIINLLPGRGGILVSDLVSNPIPSYTMDGFLDSIQGFDIVVTGHRHRLSVQNNRAKNITYDGIEKAGDSYRLLLDQMNTERSQVAETDLNLFLNSRSYLTHPWGNYENFKSVLVNKLIREYYQADLTPWPLDTIKSKIVHWIVESPNSTKFQIGNEIMYCWITGTINNSDEMLDYHVNEYDIMNVAPYN